MKPAEPTFQQYQEALQRLRRRIHLRRACMFRGVAPSVEMPALDEEEQADQRVCQRWSEKHGFYTESY